MAVCSMGPTMRSLTAQRNQVAGQLCLVTRDQQRGSDNDTGNSQDNERARRGSSAKRNHPAEDNDDNGKQRDVWPVDDKDLKISDPRAGQTKPRQSQG